MGILPEKEIWRQPKKTNHNRQRAQPPWKKKKSLKEKFFFPLFPSSHPFYFTGIILIADKSLTVRQAATHKAQPSHSDTFTIGFVSISSMARSLRGQAR
jgi:hypothetical protein